jgi:3-isopropylmalate/(R)-2-methylmalate dehydratase small subunit
MEPFTTVVGPAAPLLLPDVDTDVLAPAHGGGPFGPLRGPGFVLDDPRFVGAPILLAGRNFGCGSSRESAVWGLKSLGFRVIVAPSFGDIFAGNCVQNGVVPIAHDVDELAAEADGRAFTVDLDALAITTPSGRSVAFTIDAGWRARLLAGVDELTATLERLDDIAAFQAADRTRRPWVHDIPAGADQ